MNLTRRNLITGLATLIAAPTIVRASSIMHVRSLDLRESSWTVYWSIDGRHWEIVSGFQDIVTQPHK